MAGGPHRKVIVIVGASAIGAATFAGGGLSGIFLPGTQPEVVETFDSPRQCLACHQGENTGVPVTIGNDWQGSMMGHSARDPIFYAAVAIANKYRDGSGEFCIRCHSPGGWLEGRSDPPTGEGLMGTDLEGVQCDVCHRLKDAMAPDSTANPPVPGYGNGMMIAQIPAYPKRGPFPDAIQFHPTLEDSVQRSSNLCGTCHNVSNPFYAADPVLQSPHEYSPIERTYSEWLLSSFPTLGESGTCQSCHMSPDTGYGCIVPGAPLRPNIPKHDLTGGNTFVPEILYDFWGEAVDTAALRAGKFRAFATLQRAAMLDLTAERVGDSIVATVQITNLTGHKLPTGYPEGRRMWLSIEGRDTAGNMIFQSGAYNPQSGDLTLDDQIKVYEVKPGLTESTAAQYGLDPGPSFHFVLNDTIFFDNRIPPIGFTNASFQEHHAEPVGYAYGDGQYWDITTYRLPPGVASVTAVLYYQTASKEYVTFLRDENAGNPFDWNEWGESLYEAWEQHGKSRPVIMDSTSVAVILTGIAQAPSLPERVVLDQNYPNPFNPTTEIGFSLPHDGTVTLRIYDILGREIATLLHERMAAGSYARKFNAGRLPSGIYYYRLETSEFSQTKKMILAK
jgi:hypothetical protein